MGEVTEPEVKVNLGFAPDAVLPAPDGAHLSACVRAVNVLIVNTVPRVRHADPAIAFPADVQQAGVMQAVALFKRRNTPGGIAGYSEMGATYVARWDPDIERLTLTGSWAPPVVG